jgi:cation transport ATPase
VNAQPGVNTTDKSKRITLPVYNLGCGGGGSLTVERILIHTPGVVQAYVNPATEMAYIEYDPGQSDLGKLAAIIERAGFGPRTITLITPLSRPKVQPSTLVPRRLALAGGLWLVGIFAVSTLMDLLFPTQLQLYRLWEQVLIGFNPNNRWTLLLGFIEAFAYGALGTWGFASLCNALQARGSAESHGPSIR